MILADAAATRALGASLGGLMQARDVLLLEGELGAGKTTFTQGLASGLGIAEDVLSPTFALMSEYRGGQVPLLHVDAYRLNGPAEADQLGLDEYLDNGWALAVEWAGKGEGALPLDALALRFEYEGDARRVTIQSRGTRSATLLENLNAASSGD
jgi:tRNA threonylcarbamoyladenosine biosynthesis protein TsaE